MTHRLTKGTEYYGLNEVFSNISVAYLKKKQKTQKTPPTKNQKTCGLCEFLQLSRDSLQRASLQPSARQAPLPRSVSSSAGLGPWLPSAMSQFKAQLRGKINQNRPGQEKFGICSFKGTNSHIKIPFLSKNFKTIYRKDLGQWILFTCYS